MLSVEGQIGTGASTMAGSSASARERDPLALQAGAECRSMPAGGWAPRLIRPRRVEAAQLGLADATSRITWARWPPMPKC
jgi:hypothetical protein